MNNLNLEKKTAVQPVIVASSRSLQKRNFDLSARNLTGKPMKLNLGFPWCKTNSKQEKKKDKEKAATSKLVGVKFFEIYRSGL